MPIILGRWNDGSATAPVGGNFQQPNFFTTCRQSSQTYATRPSWMVAGVDYAIGIDAAHINSLIDPVVSQPANCTVSTNNRIQWAGIGSNQTIEGYDFSLNNGANTGVELRLDGTSAGTSTLTIKNCKFFNGSNVQGGSYLISTVSSVGAAFNLIIQGCYFDGNYTNFPNSNLTALASHAGSSGSFTSKYNVFLRSPQSFTETSAANNRIEMYNYGEDMVAPGTSGHHASWPSSQFGSGVIPLYIFSFNTALMNKNAGPTDGGVTSICEIGCNGGSQITTCNVDNNTIVVNKNNTGGTLLSYSIEENGSGVNMTINQLTLTNNYCDISGSIDWNAQVSSPIINKSIIQRNINLVTGGALT